MATVQDWVESNFGVYFDNATSRRDFRAQLRGNRAVMLWSIYLITLIGLGMYTYVSSVARGSVSVVAAQGTLQTFYQTVMYILGFTVLLVAPALAATSIVIERERHSLDLVFSAPVKPKALLVGKMISAYRYTWMLLALSLPVTALCVVLGGQTWSQVLGSYALLSFHALVYSAIALTISAVSRKPVGALIYTYVAALGYFWISSGVGETLSLRTPFGVTEAPFWVTLSPLNIVQAASTHTTIAGIAIPNWIFFAVFAIFVTRIFLLGAASALSPYNSPETKNFRITGLVTVGILTALIASAYFGQNAAVSADAPIANLNPPSNDLVAGDILAFLPLTLLLFLPFLSCSGSDGERKFWPNGNFSIKEAFRGTPAGGLPYIFMLLAVVMVTAWTTCILATGEWPYSAFYSSVIWAAGFWTFLWSLGRWSSATISDLRPARTLHLAILITVLGLPLPFLTMFDPDEKSVFWAFYPLSPLWSNNNVADPRDMVIARLAMGAALLICGLTITYLAARKTNKGLSEEENEFSTAQA